jgi:hypothetical protein
MHQSASIVSPANAGIHGGSDGASARWPPAFAGVTDKHLEYNDSFEIQTLTENTMRRLLILTIAALATFPALAQDDAATLRLACKAANPALNAGPFAFSIDEKRGEATETISGKTYGVITYRDGFGLYDPAGGRSALVFRIDRVSGAFARVDKQIKVEGACEKVERRF